MPFGRRIELQIMTWWVESMLLSLVKTKYTAIGTIRNSNNLSRKLIYLMQVVLAWTSKNSKPSWSLTEDSKKTNVACTIHYLIKPIKLGPLSVNLIWKVSRNMGMSLHLSIIKSLPRSTGLTSCDSSRYLKIKKHHQPLKEATQCQV